MCVVGIDLGTTNSLVAHYDNGQATLLPNALGEFLTPSAVSVDESTGEFYIGKIARQRLTSHPQLSVSAFKRTIGTQKVYTLGKQKFNSEELSALVLKSLKADAEKALGGEVSDAVISVPAYFNDTQRAATMAAAKLADLNVTRLVNEPTAAAIQYGIELDSEQHFLVLDLGGGTFDVTVLEVFDGILEVHASAGDNYLGGEDFTRLLADDIVKRYSLENAPDSTVFEIADKLKQRLTDRPDATFETTINDQAIAVDYSREELDALAQPLLGKISTPIAKALKDAKLAVSDLDNIVLVGGATRMPAFTKFISKMFKTFPEKDHNPDHVVALGAALQAGLISREKGLEEVVLTDVMPFSLGTGVMDESNLSKEVFSPIIERNITIPVSRVQSYTSIHENQKKLEFNVYQGESRNVANNVRLGKLEIDLPATKEIEVVDLRYTYDTNGLLQIDACVLSNGKTFSHVLQNNSERMSESEIKKSIEKLAHLKVHPAEKQENQVVRSRGEHLYELCSGELRETVSGLLAHFELELSSQDDGRIATAREQVSKQFDLIEESYFQ